MVSVRMNNTDSQFDKLEANLHGLSARMPDVPLTEILLSRLIQHAGREMAAKFEQQIRPFGLAEAEFRVLTTLFSHPEGVAHPSDLCVRTAQSPANMSRISDALVSRDLITRVLSVHDRRRMVLRITEQGEDLVRRLLPTMFPPLRALFADFSDTEQRQLITQFKRLYANISEANKPGAEDANKPGPEEPPP
jgi:MarR family transcriptional regulator, negative regulator of the multidrug operon emrRAB